MTTATIRIRGVMPNPNQLANNGAIARIGVTFTKIATGITVFSTSAKREANIPRKIKEERFDTIMMEQQKINFNKNKDLIGKTEKVIIDKSSKDENWSIARSYRDAPEIDNYVKIDKKLEVGKFYTIKVKEAFTKFSRDVAATWLVLMTQQRYIINPIRCL